MGAFTSTNRERNRRQSMELGKLVEGSGVIEYYDFLLVKFDKEAMEKTSRKLYEEIDDAIWEPIWLEFEIELQIKIQDVYRQTYHRII